MSAPYITYDILINAPTGITWANYVQKNSSLDRLMNDICFSATADIDNECNQTLRCSIDTEIIVPGSARLSVTSYGAGKAILSRFPVIEVISAKTSPAAMIPRNWQPIPVNRIDLDGSLLGIYSSSVGDSSGIYPRGILLSPGIIRETYGKVESVLSVQYLNGWPHCLVGTEGTLISAGVTTLTVDDVTGWPGVSGILYDGTNQETLSVISIEDSTGNIGPSATGPGTITLLHPTIYAHTPISGGMLLSSLPYNVIQAAKLYCFAQIVERTPSTFSLPTGTGGSTVQTTQQQADAYKAQGAKLLKNFRLRM